QVPSLPWAARRGGPAEESRRALDGRPEASRAGDLLGEAVRARLEAGDVLNAAVGPVRDLGDEERSGKELRFERVAGDGDSVVLGMRSLIPPARENYVLLHRVDDDPQWHTDRGGLSEVWRP